jgi:hypothetical protein
LPFVTGHSRTARVARLAVLVGTIMVVGCSDHPPTVSTAAAADSLVRGLGLPSDVTPCLRSEMEGEPGARQVLDPEAQPTEKDFDALDAVVIACVPAETLAASLSVMMANGYRSVAEVTAGQEQCLHDRMAALGEDDRGLLATGQLSQLRDPTSERATAVTEVLHRLLDACGIVVGTAPTAPGTSTE